MNISRMTITDIMNSYRESKDDPNYTHKERLEEEKNLPIYQAMYSTATTWTPVSSSY